MPYFRFGFIHLGLVRHLQFTAQQGWAKIKTAYGIVVTGIPIESDSNDSSDS